VQSPSTRAIIIIIIIMSSDQQYPDLGARMNGAKDTVVNSKVCYLYSLHKSPVSTRGQGVRSNRCEK